MAGLLYELWPVASGSWRRTQECGLFVKLRRRFPLDGPGSGDFITMNDLLWMVSGLKGLSGEN